MGRTLFYFIIRQFWSGTRMLGRFSMIWFRHFYSRFGTEWPEWHSFGRRHFRNEPFRFESIKCCRDVVFHRKQTSSHFLYLPHQQRSQRAPWITAHCPKKSTYECVSRFVWVSASVRAGCVRSDARQMYERMKWAALRSFIITIHTAKSPMKYTMSIA